MELICVQIDYSNIVTKHNENLSEKIVEIEEQNRISSVIYVRKNVNRKWKQIYKQLSGWQNY